MNNQVILITGALTGIGRPVALAAAGEGYRVVVSGRNAQSGEALQAELHARGEEAMFIQADVRSEIEVRSLVEAAVAKFGHIDAAVNNAGTEGVAAPIVDLTPEAYATAFETNVLGVLLCMKYELRAMQTRHAGSIINISSTMGSRGAPMASLYVASKHAVEGLTKSAALEAASHGIRVNAVAPGPVETGMLERFTGSAERKAGLLASIPLGRAGKPEELADAILFLASDKASFVTGQIVNVNGGKTAS